MTLSNNRSHLSISLLEYYMTLPIACNLSSLKTLSPQLVSSKKVCYNLEAELLFVAPKLLKIAQLLSECTIMPLAPFYHFTILLLFSIWNFYFISDLYSNSQFSLKSQPPIATSSLSLSPSAITQRHHHWQ